jgi:hypothetical protein
MHTTDHISEYILYKKKGLLTVSHYTGDKAALSVEKPSISMPKESQASSLQRQEHVDVFLYRWDHSL